MGVWTDGEGDNVRLLYTTNSASVGGILFCGCESGVICGRILRSIRDFRSLVLILNMLKNLSMGRGFSMFNCSDEILALQELLGKGGLRALGVFGILGDLGDFGDFGVGATEDNCCELGKAGTEDKAGVPALVELEVDVYN